MEDAGAGLLEKKAAFDKRTAQYLGMGFDRIAAAEFVAAAAGGITGPALDVGTGRGVTAIALARRVTEVVSIDVDATDRDLASLLAEEAGVRARIRFELCDAASLPFRDGSFGCVATMDALHHLADPVAALGEFKRVLSPDGKLVLADFSAEGFELIARAHREQGREHPVLGVSLGEAEDMLARLGMRRVVRRSGHLHEVSVMMREGAASD